MQLIRPLQFNEKVQPIALSETEVPLGAKLQMVGWMISDHEKTTANLKQVTLTTIDHEECQSFHEKDLSESEFCTRTESENYCKVRRYYKKYNIKKIVHFFKYILHISLGWFCVINFIFIRYFLLLIFMAINK